MHRRDCCSLRIVCRTLESKRKGRAIDSDGDSRTTKVGADLFEFNNQHYLLIVDYFSKWPKISKLDNLSAKNVISYMKSQISRYGIPDELISDNGPQFACEEFAQFMKDYDIKHTTSSPYHPQANGQAERTVQTVQSTTWLQKQSSTHWILSWADGWRERYPQHPNSYNQDMAIPRSRSRNSTSTRRRAETCRHFEPVSQSWWSSGTPGRELK